MHSLDFLLKGLILKLAMVALLVLAATVTVVVMVWIARRFLRHKSRRVKAAVLIITTPVVFAAVGYALAATATTAIYHLWAKPAKETHANLP